MNEEGDRVSIQISNEKGIFFFPIYLSIIVALPVAFFFMDLDVILLGIILLIPFYWFVAWLMEWLIKLDNPDSSHKSPHIYILQGKNLEVLTFSAKIPIHIDLTNVIRLIFKNKEFRKLIAFDYFDEKRKLRRSFSPPLLEKCETEWQRLFEEVKKRVPENTEIIIK